MKNSSVVHQTLCARHFIVRKKLFMAARLLLNKKKNPKNGKNQRLSTLLHNLPKWWLNPDTANKTQPSKIRLMYLLRKKMKLIAAIKFHRYIFQFQSFKMKAFAVSVIQTKNNYSNTSSVCLGLSGFKWTQHKTNVWKRI